MTTELNRKIGKDKMKKKRGKMGTVERPPYVMQSKPWVLAVWVASFKLSQSNVLANTLEKNKNSTLKKERCIDIM